MSLRKTWTVLDVWSQYKWEGEKAEVAGTKHSRAATVTPRWRMESARLQKTTKYLDLNIATIYTCHLAAHSSAPCSGERWNRFIFRASNASPCEHTPVFCQHRTGYPQTATHSHATTTHSPTHERAQRSRLNTRPARMPTNLGR